MSDALHRLHRIARPMAGLATVALVAIPVGVVIALSSGALTETRLRRAFAETTLPEVISPLGWGVSLGVGAVLLALSMLALWHMRALFTLYARGDVLGPAAARRIRRIGLTLLSLAAVSVVGRTLIILALTSTNPPGQRALTIGIGSQDLFLVFSASLLIAIGWAMSEAARIAEENRGFI